MDKVSNEGKKSFYHEEWFNLQTPQWNAMMDAGWCFTTPPIIPKTVGITMSRGSDSATFRVGLEWTREEYNTRLLRFCKAFAESSDTSSSTGHAKINGCL